MFSSVRLYCAPCHSAFFFVSQVTNPQVTDLVTGSRFEFADLHCEDTSTACRHYNRQGPCQLIAFHMDSHYLRKDVIHLLLLMIILLKAPLQY